METMREKWPAEKAREVASEVCARLRGGCVRLEVAGSLRRGKAEVGDVEILYVPRMMEEWGDDMFESRKVSMAEEEIERMLEDGTLKKRPNKIGVVAWGEKNKLAVHRGGMPVDLFCTSTEGWWNCLVCRTGPAESNVRICEEARKRGWKWHPYGEGFSRLSDGKVQRVRSEEEVFEFVGLPFFEPGSRG